MPAPRAVLAVVPFVVIASASCRVATQQNELYEGDQIAESAQASRPGPSRTASAELDASIVEASVDAAVDAEGDAAVHVPPPCAKQSMYSSAPATICTEASYALIGGTLPLGGFHLTRWTDQQKSCSAYYSKRQGTMSLEEANGKIFMRWLLSVDGNETWGTYELTRYAPNAFKRTEVCNWTPQTPAVVVEYQVVSPDEILFVHLNGQEKWTRIPKPSATDNAPPPPIGMGS